MIVPDVAPGENQWTVVGLASMLLLPDTSVVGDYLQSTALEPTPVGFVLPFDLDRDKQWDIYLEVAIPDGVDGGGITVESARSDPGLYQGGSNLAIRSSYADTTYHWLRTTLGHDADNWDAAADLDPAELSLLFLSDVPVAGFAYREYVEVIELPDPNAPIDLLQFAMCERGQMQYNEELGQLTSSGTAGNGPEDGILLRLNGDFDRTRFYRIETRLFAAGDRTVQYLVADNPVYPAITDVLAAGVLAPPSTGDTSPSAMESSVLVGPGIGDWDQIVAGEDPILYITVPADADYGPSLYAASMRPVAAPGGGGGGSGGGAYGAAITTSAPILSWELDEDADATQVTDSSGNGYHGAYTNREFMRFGEPSLIGDESGSSMMFGDGNAERSVGVALYPPAAPPPTTSGISYQISYTPPSLPPATYMPEEVEDDISTILLRGFTISMQFTHSGGIYSQAYGAGNVNMLILQVGSNTGFGSMVAHIEPDIAHLITFTMDDTGLCSLYVDGALTPTYTDLFDALGANIYNPIHLDISGGFGTSDGIFLAGGGGAVQSGSGARYDSFHVWNRGLTPEEVTGLYDAWTSPPVSAADTFGSASSNATGAELELFDADFAFAGDAEASGVSAATADAQVMRAQYGTGAASARSSVTVSAPKHTITALRTGVQIEALISGSYVAAPAAMTMFILDDVQERTPTALTVVLSGAIPGGMVQFFNGGAYLYQVRADSAGSLSAVSIPIPATAPGLYTLRATSGSREASDTFTLNFGPTTLKEVSPDADPVEVPGALRDDGSRAWVLQDLLPGGLGSYVMPRSPVEGVHPTSERKLTDRHSTAVDGQHHVWEALSNEYEWTFTGVTFTEDDQEKLYAYGDLNRRFYLMNDRNEAWVVSFTQVEIVPRLRKLTATSGQAQLELNDWLADYTVRVVTHDNTWRTPIPLEG